MAIGTLIGSLAGAAATAGASSLFSKAFGSKGSKNPTAPLQSFTPPGINAGGLKATFGEGGVTVNSSAERQGLVSGLAGQSGAFANTIAQLRDMVTPGIGGLTKSRLEQIENARLAATGNLRDNLARRRVLGSSFGQDALARAELEFGKEKERVAAESFLQELEATTQLVQQEFTARRDEFQTQLTELNLEATLASTLSTKATDALARNAQVESLLNAQEAEGLGKFFGQTFQPVANSISKGVSSLFGGNSTSNIANSALSNAGLGNFGLQF